MAFLSPRQLINELNIKENSTLVDVGAGSGAYIYEACRVNGKGGKIIAIDIDKDKLKLVHDTAKVGGYDVDILECNVESGIVLADYSADYIIIANTLHQIAKDKRIYVLKEINRILSPIGEALYVEWSSHALIGPSDDLIINREEALKYFEKSGLKVKKELPAGDYHYAYILEK